MPRQPVTPGRVLEIAYPVCNRYGVPVERRSRIIRIESIRDLRKEPLSLETVLRHPLVRRTAKLATATDLDDGSLRHFYVGREIGFRFGRIDPETGELRLGKTVFDPTPQDALAMREAINAFCRRYGQWILNDSHLVLVPVERPQWQRRFAS